MRCRMQSASASSLRFPDASATMVVITSLSVAMNSCPFNPKNVAMTTIAGNEAGFEEAARALFASDRSVFEQRIADWLIGNGHRTCVLEG